MDQKFPLVSVVVPMYNVEQYISSFIDRIENQSYENWELLLVDDGSNDTTIDIVKKHCAQDDRVFLFQRDRAPKGADTCRNIGMSKSKGKYIIIFDADDLVEPICFQQRVIFMEGNPGLEFSSFPGKTLINGEDGKSDQLGRDWGVKTNKDILKSFLGADYPYAVWNNIYLASFIKDQAWDEKLKIYQDFDFLITTLLRKPRHAYASDARVDYYYCLGNPNSITSKFINEEKYISTKYLFEKILKELNEAGYDKKYIIAFSKYFLLQYERVVLSGSLEQLSDFTKFYCKNTYKKKTRVKMFTFLIKNKIIKKSSVKQAYIDFILHPWRQVKKIRRSI